MAFAACEYGEGRCYGSGKEVLETRDFAAVNFSFDLVLLVVQYVVLHFLGFLLLRLRARRK